MTLTVHPRFGEEIAVISPHGRNAVWAETSDGKARLLPIAWTTLRPRPEPLAFRERAVHLAPEALRELALWTAARAGHAEPDAEVGHFDKRVENPGPDGSAVEGAMDLGRGEGIGVGNGERSRAGGEPTAAVVGEARSRSARRRAKRARGGSR